MVWCHISLSRRVVNRSVNLSIVGVEGASLAITRWNGTILSLNVSAYHWHSSVDVRRRPILCDVQRGNGAILRLIVRYIPRLDRLPADDSRF